ncbi:Ger(x)C family spore germination protein [Neobacillus sp. MM2021_6]|uniref:Ger(x)C family spore germination protein n=1 Tax=Bacillaceae TaxID=186817 RepID=UPI00140BCCA6|nr:MULTISPECIES: Ger(x)C family spore germination protein [Bacillaceae]MBO0962288.1 Ger(x)C family spore germination protein [Neobacillus sp. MM2021_6]NHC19437.1 Ger(x)C family spore germination protein [Bacillus sp. MM2020_4]
MRIKKCLLTITTILCFSILSGCWNYREIEDLVVVGGVAIDKGKDGRIFLTVETIQMEAGAEHPTQSKSFTISGKTIFDAVRNEIALTGKRLYWSHNKAVIISQDIAKEGILEILDWFHRDSETRADINILVSKEKTAREILLGEPAPKEIVSLALEEMLKNQKSLNKAPVVKIWKVINEIEASGIVTALPVVALQKRLPKMNGTAIFNKDKLIGFLDGEETEAFLFVRDEIRGGLLVVGKEDDITSSQISLEIFKSKTNLKPTINKADIKMNIHIDTTVTIDEINGKKNYMEERKKDLLEKSFEKIVSQRVEKVIKHVQSEYKVDIFGFGEKIREEDPQVWNQIKSSWENKFQYLPVNVTSNVHIKGSGMLAEPLKRGD